MKQFKRILFTMIIMVILVMTLTATVNAASSKDKKQIKEVIKQYMTGCKQESSAKIMNTLVNPEDFADGLSTITTTPNASSLVNKRAAANKKIKYSIKSIKIKGNTATVKVKVKSPTAKKAIIKAYDDLLWYTWGSEDENITDDELEYFAGRALNYLKKNPIKMYSRMVTFKCQKMASGWKIANYGNTLSDIYCLQINAAYEAWIKKYA